LKNNRSNQEQMFSDPGQAWTNDGERSELYFANATLAAGLPFF